MKLVYSGKTKDVYALDANMEEATMTVKPVKPFGNGVRSYLPLPRCWQLHASLRHVCRRGTDP